MWFVYVRDKFDKCTYATILKNKNIWTRTHFLTISTRRVPYQLDILHTVLRSRKLLPINQNIYLPIKILRFLSQKYIAFRWAF